MPVQAHYKQILQGSMTLVIILGCTEVTAENVNLGSRLSLVRVCSGFIFHLHLGLYISIGSLLSSCQKDHGRCSSLLSF